MDPLFTFADGVGVGLIIWSLLQTLLDDPYVINYIQVASILYQDEKKLFFVLLLQLKLNFLISVDSCALKRWNGEGKKF